MTKKEKSMEEQLNEDLQAERAEAEALASAEEEKKAAKKNQKRWYIVHTVTGHENKVKVNLEKRIEYMNMGEKIFRVEVPQKTVTQMKGGKKQEREEKIFPGYVLVEMIMDEDSWYVVRHTAGVTKFVGSAKKPIPARDSEIKKIINRSTSTAQKIELDVKAGDKVRIISGPFADFVADIIEVYPDKSKLRANVSIFGRETPVELEPPVGPALGQHGVNIMDFCKQFNAKTESQAGYIIPVVIDVYEDRSFTFVTKSPPAPVLIKKALNLSKGSAAPNKDKVAEITQAQLEEIAKIKMDDLNATTMEAAVKMIKGSCRAMGVTVKEA